MANIKMPERVLTTMERGRFKEDIHATLYKSGEIRELLLGDTSGMSVEEVQKAFKAHVASHLFIDDTITEAGTYIFYDVICPSISQTMKSCRVLMYVVCTRTILDGYEKVGFFGNRADVLSQMIEKALLNDHEIAGRFSIGELTLDSIDIYNSTKMYGTVMTFSASNFRWK